MFICVSNLNLITINFQFLEFERIFLTWTRSSLPLRSPVSVSSRASLAFAHFSRSSFNLPNFPS